MQKKKHEIFLLQNCDLWKLSKGKNETLPESGNSTTDGMNYIWQSSSAHDVCMVNESNDHLEFLVCLTDVLPQSKSILNYYKVILLPAVGL